jgi:hypothetical protein
MKYMKFKSAVLPLLALLGTSVAQAHDTPEGFLSAWRTYQRFEAGRSYTISTTILGKRDLLQPQSAATHVLLIDPDDETDSGRLVAQGGTANDRLESRFSFRPTVTKDYYIVVTSSDTNTSAPPAKLGDPQQCGNAHLTIHDNTSGFEEQFVNISFCGKSHFIRHHAGECFNAAATWPRTDPYIFYFPTNGFTDIVNDSTVRWNNDFSAKDSRLCFPNEGSGWILSTSAWVTGEGLGEVDLADHTRLQTENLQPIDDSTVLPATSVFRTYVELRANFPNLVQTANLGKRDFFQGPAPDTVLYVIDTATHSVIARNDDGYPGSFASQLVVRPAETKNYLVLVRARTRSTPGNMDLVVNGAVVARGRAFAGEMLRPYLKPGLINGAEDCIETRLLSGNPYFAWFPNSSNSGDTGGRFISNDNGSGSNAKVCFSDFAELTPDISVTRARGMLVLGSSTTATEGNTRFKITGSSHD